MNRTIFGLVGFIFLSNIGLSHADTLTLTTVSDFQEADIQNGIVTNTDDGEIIQNCYLDPAVLTITSTALPIELYKHASCKIGDTIVVSGGLDLSTYTNSVYLNIIQNNDLTTWQSGPDLPVAVRDHQMIQLGNYVYSFGGRTATGVIANSYRSLIDFNTKTIDDWEPIADLPQGLERFAAIKHMGKIYILGGSDGSAISNVYMSDLDPNGNLMGWQELNSLPAAVMDLNVCVFGNRLFIIGGNNGFTDSAAIYSAEINTDGSLNAWETKTSYPIPISRHSICTTSVGIIVVGGVSNGVNQSTLYSSALTEDYELIQWQLSSLSENLLDHAAILSGDQLFLIGGRNDVTPIAVSRRIPLNEYDAWKQSTPMTDLIKGPIGLSGIHNYAYYTGGQDATNEYTDKIYKATFSSSGGVSSWAHGGYLPVSIYAHSLASYNDRMYLLGGAVQGEGNTNAVYYSNSIISGDGNITDWTRTTALPNTMTAHQSIAINGYLYVIYEEKVYYSIINIDGSLAGSWTQTAGLPISIGRTNVSSNNNKLYVVLNTAPVRVLYAEANGNIAGWTETISLPLKYGTQGATWAGNNEIFMVFNAGYAIRGHINTNGDIFQWDALEDGAFSAMNLNVYKYNERINVYGALMYPLFMQINTHHTSLTIDINFDASKTLRALSWQSTYPSMVQNYTYRLFDNNQWSPWQFSNGDENDVVLNNVGQYLQLGWEVTTYRKNDGQINFVTLQYSDIPPTPIPTATLMGFDGQIIHEKYTYAYPNPLRGKIAKFRVYTREVARLTLEVYTTSNQLVYSEDTYSSGVGYHEFSWNCANMANGVYLYRIKAIGNQSGIEESVLKKLAIIE